MANYDFTQDLSPVDFELLSKDLLEADLKIRFENFKEGKDLGIDLRHAPASGGETTVVQCKRYASSAFSRLKSDIKKKELPKIKKLNPSRYILTTSVALSAAQVDELKKDLAPYVRGSGDIYGRNRLNSLLVKHPEVLRQHNKLWIGSAGILEGILAAGIHTVSRDELERAIKSAKIYVKNESFDEALRILKDHRVCIISGIPGIGKTTLARMLMLYFHKLGFELVKIESNISEARSLPFHKKPRFYYYDDFLGQAASADKFAKNEDQQILDFLKSVRDSNTSVMVLTTREYILNQAKMIYERFDRARLDKSKCILDLSKYSRRIKAQILYNHLYFSDLPKDYVNVIVVGKVYRDIVDHPNYSPRLISVLTDVDRVGDSASKDYGERFVRDLDDPTSLWEHAYRRQLGSGAKNLLLILTTMPTRAVLSEVEVVFVNFHRRMAKLHSYSSTPEDFVDALKELDGSFIGLRNVRGGSLIQFHNPSIRDYMQKVLFGGSLIQELIESAVFYEQISWFWEMINDEGMSVFRKLRGLYNDCIVENAVRVCDAYPCRRIIRISGSQEETIFRGSTNHGYRLVEIDSMIRESGYTKNPLFVEEQLEILAERV